MKMALIVVTTLSIAALSGCGNGINYDLVQVEMVPYTTSTIGPDEAVEIDISSVYRDHGVSYVRRGKAASFMPSWTIEGEEFRPEDRYDKVEVRDVWVDDRSVIVPIIGPNTSFAARAKGKTTINFAVVLTHRGVEHRFVVEEPVVVFDDSQPEPPKIVPEPDPLPPGPVALTGREPICSSRC